MTIRTIKHTFATKDQVTVAIFPTFHFDQKPLLGFASERRPEWQYISRLIKIGDELFWASLTLGENVILDKTSEHKIGLSRANSIIDAARAVTTNSQGDCRLEEITFHTDGYAEPGYKDPDSGVIATGNYNDITKWDKETNQSVVLDNTPRRVGDLLEKAGVELEWSDEWDACSRCGKLVRTSPDSYSWQRSYVGDPDGSGESICCECVENDEDIRQDYLQSIEGEDNHCVTLDGIDLEENGYKLIKDDFENGFHAGMDASPANIAKLLREVGCTRYLFRLDEASQFYCGFSVWLHKDEDELFDAAQDALNTGKTDGPSVSEGLKRALQSVPPISQQTGEGIHYTKIDASTGTSTTRLVSPEEFINGIQD